MWKRGVDQGRMAALSISLSRRHLHITPGGELSSSSPASCMATIRYHTPPRSRLQCVEIMRSGRPTDAAGPLLSFQFLRRFLMRRERRAVSMAAVCLVSRVCGWLAARCHARCERAKMLLLDTLKF